MTDAALIIGYGSPIRGDDAIGPLVADDLQNRMLPDSVTVLARHDLGADLVPIIASATRVVFVDACLDGEPGRIYRQRLDGVPETAAPMAHTLDPGELLAWARVLYGTRPETYLLSTPGVSFDYGSYRLTPAVQRARASLAEQALLLARGGPPDSVESDALNLE